MVEHKGWRWRCCSVSVGGREGKGHGGGEGRGILVLKNCCCCCRRGCYRVLQSGVGQALWLEKPQSSAEGERVAHSLWKE